MKREERNNDENPDRSDPWKRDKQNNDKSKKKDINVSIGDQMKAYSSRQKMFSYNIEKCENKYDPMHPDRRLKMNDALFFLKDKKGKVWCFNLITLWPKFEVANSYDVEGIYRHYGNVLLTVIDTKETEFEISIEIFVRLKKAYYKYAHNIVWNPEIFR